MLILVAQASMWGRAFPALVALQAGRCEAVTVCGCPRLHPRLHADSKNPKGHKNPSYPTGRQVAEVELPEAAEHLEHD